MSSLPLSDLKVLSFGWVIAGPLTDKYLADYGATVVRVESATRPDVTRTSPPYLDRKPGLDRSGYYAFYNCNKLSIAVNWNHPRATFILLRLGAWADVVVENYAPGALEEHGLAYEDLCRVNPDIILLRSSNMGQTGPARRQPGYGLQLAGLSGFCHITGWPDRGINQPFGAYTDYIAGPLGAALILGALDYRRRTGKGQCLDLSQWEAALQFMAPLVLDWQSNGREPSPQGNRSERYAPHGAFRCLGDDMWCAVEVHDDSEWMALCHVMGDPAWCQDERFATLLGRKRNEDELEQRIEEWTSSWDAYQLMEALQSDGVPAGVVQNALQVRHDPQLQARDHFWKLPGAAGVCQGQVIRLSNTPSKPRLAPPRLGEHTAYVCGEFLGMPDAEFLDCLNSGVFE